MTKAEIIRELHECGQMWANESYTKAYLQNWLEGFKEAESMSLEELRAKILENKRG